AHVVMVEVVADLLEAGGLEAVSFIDDEQLCAPAGAGLGVNVGVNDAVLSEVHGKGDSLASTRKPLIDLTRRGGDSGCEERGAGIEHPFRYGAEGVSEE